MHTTPFFDPATFSYSYVLSDPISRQAIVIDPVLGYDAAGGRLMSEPVEPLIKHINDQHLTLTWILETHIHADHLSAAAYLQARLGGRIGISERVTEVQHTFAERFNADPCFRRDGSQFDALFRDGERVQQGALSFQVIATPGHTPACVTYLFEDGAFVGDTLFMPDYGTARTDFPGGDAATLFQSIQKILSLPDATPLYVCHDYGTATRTEFQHRTSVAEQRHTNTHVAADTKESEFVRMRQCRDATLKAPALLYPAIQFNMRAGQLPSKESNGERYFKIPVQEV